MSFCKTSFLKLKYNEQSATGGFLSFPSELQQITQETSKELEVTDHKVILKLVVN